MRKKILLAWFFLALAIVIANCLFALEERLRFNLEAVAQFQGALYLIHDLRVNLLDAETVRRGYALAGEEGNLEAHQAAIREADRIFNKLNVMTANELEQQRLLGVVKVLITRKEALWANAIELRRQNALQGSEYAFLMQEGAQIRNELRKAFDQLEESEKILVSPR